jgi:uncharacterized caspase-like protein
MVSGERGCCEDAGTSSEELAGFIREIKAQKVFVLIDPVGLAFRGFEDRKALSQISRSTGVHVIAASTKDQFTAKTKELGQGVFTYTLLEGLKGAAAAQLRHLEGAKTYPTG